MPASDETDRLLQMQKQHSQGSQYYFLNKSNVDYQGGSTATVKDADGGVVIEDTPADSDPNEFAPRPLIHHAVRFLFRWSISLCCSGSMCVCVMMMVPQQRRDDDQRRASQPAKQHAHRKPPPCPRCCFFRFAFSLSLLLLQTYVIAY
jgi:hypothetical protein